VAQRPGGLLSNERFPGAKHHSPEPTAVCRHHLCSNSIWPASWSIRGEVRVKGTTGRKSTRSHKPVAADVRFAVCVDNDGYEASLERNKIYVVLPLKTRRGMVTSALSTRTERTMCCRLTVSLPSMFRQPSRHRS
jgi:hypothetical protein